MSVRDTGSGARIVMRRWVLPVERHSTMPGNLEAWRNLTAKLESTRRFVHIFFFQAEDGIRDYKVTGVQTCALPISLVLLDIQLPGRDGFGVLADVQKIEGDRPWKVVALTAHAMPGDRDKALAAGFDGYITKPIDVRNFPDEVARYLG